MNDDKLAIGNGYLGTAMLKALGMDHLAVAKLDISIAHNRIIEVQAVIFPKEGQFKAMIDEIESRRGVLSETAKWIELESGETVAIWTKWEQDLQP